MCHILFAVDRAVMRGRLAVHGRGEATCREGRMPGKAALSWGYGALSAAAADTADTNEAWAKGWEQKRKIQPRV